MHLRDHILCDCFPMRHNSGDMHLYKLYPIKHFTNNSPCSCSVPHTLFKSTSVGERNMEAVEQKSKPKNGLLLLVSFSPLFVYWQSRKGYMEVWRGDGAGRWQQNREKDRSIITCHIISFDMSFSLGPRQAVLIHRL